MSGRALRQIRSRWVWVTWGSGGMTVWFQVAGHKPLAHLPRWRRHLLHLPVVRWRLWPKPWNFNGATGRPFRGIEAAARDMTAPGAVEPEAPTPTKGTGG